MPPDGLPQVRGRLRRANFSSLTSSFEISRYVADYRYLIAYEINTQGWKNRRGLEGVGGGCILKIAIAKGGYNFHM